MQSPSPAGILSGKDEKMRSIRNVSSDPTFGGSKLPAKRQFRKTPATVLTARGVHGTKPNVSHFPRADNASVGTVAAHDRNVKMRNKDVLLVKD
jgi:hypothetical protein